MNVDGPVALTALAINEDGTLAAYGLSKSGSDRQEIFIRNVDDGSDLRDRLRWVKFASIAWVKDGSGFYYTRFPEPGTVAGGRRKLLQHGLLPSPRRRAGRWIA